MPSPIGHLLGGVATCWGADVIDRHHSDRRLVVACALLAAAPDLDLLAPRWHRTGTHSVTAVMLVLIVTAVVTERVTRWRTSIVCAAAYASHLFFDWLGVDRQPPIGLQLLWPFSERWFISGIDLFPETSREFPFTTAVVLANIRAVAHELLIFAPVLLALWLIRVKTTPRLTPEVPGGHHPSK